jgi:hypothetical protein
MEEETISGRLVDMTLVLVAALVLLAVCGASAEAARGRRPALARKRRVRRAR